MITLEVGEELVFDGVVGVASNRDVLRVRGADAASYLHGQVSQDVEGLEVGASAWTLLLQPQGKIDAWMRLHRRDATEFWLDVEPGFGQVAKERLERFKLRVQADLDLTTVPVLALRGPGAIAAAAEADEALIALDASWGGIAGVDLLDPASLGTATTETTATDTASMDTAAGFLPAGVVQGPTELLDLVRVRQGRPAMGNELDESTIPAAARIVDQSVDFTKGCYVGQELVARIDSRGNNTPTRLFGLRFEGSDQPSVGAQLTLDGAQSGVVTTVTVSPSLGTIGLAYLKRAVEVPASLEAVSQDGRSQRADVVELPLLAR